jgi:hypothetical protein
MFRFYLSLPLYNVFHLSILSLRPHTNSARAIKERRTPLGNAGTTDQEIHRIYGLHLELSHFTTVLLALSISHVSRINRARVLLDSL